MAPNPPQPPLPRDDPSLAELFHHFPAKVWLLIKMVMFGLSIMLALVTIIFGIFYLVTYVCIHGPDAVEWLRSGKWRELVKGCSETVGRLRRIERVDRLWKWFECRNARGEAEAVDAEELEHLGSHEGEGREGSVGGETLFDGEEGEDGDGEARKKEEMELDSEDYMKGGP